MSGMKIQEEYQINISNRFSALKKLDGGGGGLGKYYRENTEASATESLG
jgi:hypothetical protein